MKRRWAEWSSVARRARQGRTSTILLMCVAVVVAACGVLATETHVFKRSELDSIDSRFSIRGGDRDTRDVVLVLVDDKTFSTYGKTRWPYPRRMQAQVLRRITAGHPRATAVDIQYTEQTDPADDNALVLAVKHAGHVVLATTETDGHGHTRIFGGDNVLRQIGARPGNANYRVDAGNTIRRVDYAMNGLESFGLVTAEVAQARRIPRSEIPKGGAWIDYRGGPGTFPSYSFSDVLQGRVPASAFHNKIVVVGASASSLQDVHATSTTGDQNMPGPEIQANVIATALDDFPLRGAPGVVGILLAIVFAFAAPLSALRVGPGRVLAAGLLTGLLYLVAAQLAFNAGLILPVVTPIVTLIFAVLGAVAAQGSLALIERARTRATFARFVPGPVVDRVLAQAGGELRLGGERRECTVLFSDVRGFTTYSEGRDPAEVIEILNRYLTEMTEAIMDHGGTLVSYMGDGIMAVFGAPLDQPDHADRALAAAREMTGPRLDRFNAWLRGLGGGEGFRMGVGLNTGPVMSGNVGSERRMEYTAIGDTVNTASRLEGATKHAPYQVLVADSTRAHLRGEVGDLEHHGEVSVKGRSEAIVVWGLRDAATPPAPHPADALADAAARAVT